MKNSKSQPESFGDHLEEVRLRLLAIIGALIAGSLVGYKLHHKIVDLLMRPIDSPLYFTNPAGGFEFLLKVSMTFGMLLALPVICYNLVRFLEPIMQKPSKRFISLLVISSILLAVGGAVFAYIVSLPAALNFLMKASVDSVEPLLSTREYFNFVLIYLAGFAALFQVPLILIIINKVTPLKPMKLFRNQRFVILISFIVAAILTPTPDPVNQTIMAAPAIVMYQFGIMAVAITNRSGKTVNQRGDTLLPQFSDAELATAIKELQAPNQHRSSRATNPRQQLQAASGKIRVAPRPASSRPNPSQTEPATADSSKSRRPKLVMQLG